MHMSRYSPKSQEFLQYADKTVAALAEVMTLMEQREAQVNPDGRWTILCLPTGVTTFLMAEGVIFGPAMAAFAADVLNYKYDDPASHYDPLTTINQLQQDLEKDRSLWALPEIFSAGLLSKYDSQKGTRHTDELIRFVLNYARELLYCDGKGLESANDVLWKLAGYYAEELNLTPPFKKYHSRNSFCIVGYLEIADIELSSVLDRIIKEQPALAAQYDSGTALLGRTIISFACSIVGLHKSVSDGQILTLRDVMLFFGMIQPLETVDTLRAKLLNWLKTAGAPTAPLTIELLEKYDQRYGTAHAVTARQIHVDIANSLVKVESSVPSEVTSWLSSFSQTMIAANKDAEAASRAAAANKSSSSGFSPAPNTVSPGAGQSSKSASSTAGDGAKPELSQEEELAKALGELDALVGLESVKKDVRDLINFLKIQNMRKEKGLPVAPMSRHLVFTGNPGTGKTTVARILAGIYKALGTLEKGHLVEADRSKLVGQYMGATAINVSEVVESALDGVLFVDEAYTLVQDEKDPFGQEAVDTLLKHMEDKRDRLIVIAAGYTDNMNKFLASNPGLRSRFNKYLNFEDYTPDQLMAILDSKCASLGFHFSDAARPKIVALIDAVYENRDGNFGNAREARNIFEKIITNQANRLVTLEAIADEMLTEITDDDVPEFVASKVV